MKLFISYRRKSWPFIHLLAQKLGEQVKSEIFIDYTSIDDTDFEQSILRHLRESDIVLVVVTEFTFAFDRIHNDDDWVRREIALALELNKPIILIRVDNHLPPPQSELPDDVRRITNMQGITFYPEYFDAAVQRLANFIYTVLSSNSRYQEQSSSIETYDTLESEPTVTSTQLPFREITKPIASKNTIIAFIASRGVIIAVLVVALITGVLLYQNNHLSSPKPTPSVNTAATATAIAACAAAPILVGPVDGQALNSRTVTMTWEAPQGCIPDGYTVRISANLDPEARPWIVDTGWAPTFYTYNFSADGTYYWHIRACKPCTPFHPGLWAIRIFTIHT